MWFLISETSENILTGRQNYTIYDTANPVKLIMKFNCHVDNGEIQINYIWLKQILIILKMKILSFINEQHLFIAVKKDNLIEA